MLEIIKYWYFCFRKKKNFIVNVRRLHILSILVGKNSDSFDLEKNARFIFLNASLHLLVFFF